MKSFFTAVIISIFLILSGYTLSKKIENITCSIGEKNQNIYTCLENEKYADAASALDLAEAEFKKHKVVFEATSDHEELLRIELAYASMREFINREQYGDAIASCSEIQLLLSHLPGNLKLKAENIL